MGYYRLLGMDKEPFSTSPDPSFLYQSAAHHAILMQLVIEVRLRRGLSVVFGDVGTGKTTLMRKLFQMLNERHDVDMHIILDPGFQSEDAFLISLARVFNLDVQPQGAFAMEELKIAIKQHLFRKGVEEGRTVVLLIDEAQKLTPASLEVLRLLLNFETHEFKLLQLVLLGQNELLPVMQGMRNLWDRISYRHMLQPLSVGETRAMIDFRLRQAGYKPACSLFTDDAVAEVHAQTQGYPRRIGMLCHNALTAAVMDSRIIVDGAAVRALAGHEVCAAV